MSIITFFSGFIGRGISFKNEYTIPENTAPYTQIDTAPKIDWEANYIWDNSDGGEENVWMCFKKTVDIPEVPEDLTAYISADSKYWLYINNVLVVFEGSIKRGPTGTDSYFELPMQQLAGICGFWTYYLYTGDSDFLRSVYNASVNYIRLWSIGNGDLVEHRGGSWDWMDWGENADVPAIENAWYYYALSCMRNIAEVIGENSAEIAQRMKKIKTGYESLWTDNGYQSGCVEKPDDRANALAVLSGLADKGKYDVITSVLTKVKNSSPYMEYYVLEALCKMEKYSVAKSRMLQRYKGMIKKDYSTLWEFWDKNQGTLNHAWSGGPLVILSKYYAGIRPVEAGYRKYIIKPQMTVSKQYSCVVPSVNGCIRINAKLTGKAFVLDAAVPKNLTAVLYIPYRNGQTVTLGGSVIYENDRFVETAGLSFEGTDHGSLVFSVTPAEDDSLHFEAK